MNDCTFKNNSIIKSEKQNVNEEKCQNSLIALALILVLTFCTLRMTIIEPGGDGFDAFLTG